MTYYFSKCDLTEISRFNATTLNRHSPNMYNFNTVKYILLHVPVYNNEQRLYDVPDIGNFSMSANENGQFRFLYRKKCIKFARKVRKPCSRY